MKCSMIPRTEENDAREPNGSYHTHPPPPLPPRPSVSHRILALHGSQGRAHSLQQLLQARWVPYLPSLTNNNPTTSNSTDLVEQGIIISTVQAPFRKYDDDENDSMGYVWWKLPPSERSFTATWYEGFEESAHRVEQALCSAGTGDETQRPYSILLGHSQGAILLTALLATQRLQPILLQTMKQQQQQQQQQQQHALKPFVTRIILNGVAWPNPYTAEFESDAFRSYGMDPSLWNDGTGFSIRPPYCRILLLVGQRDRINPPEQAERVRQALHQWPGCRVDVLYHPGGHDLPNGVSDDPDTLQRIDDWIRLDG